jgi:hypothetical protein
LEVSLFVLEKSKINFEEIKTFCDQQISEGLRIDYKRDFPKNVDLAKTICAFANTAGDIILIGVEADKEKNIPINIPGIQMTEGLEEKVVNICLSHILPRIMPEIKLCPFKPDEGSERAVLFVRVRPSYSPPHYVWQTKEILVRANNENERADLQTIEDLIERRKRIRDESGSNAGYTSWSTKSITVEAPVFETAVVLLHFAKENVVPFSKENDAILYEIANEVMRLHEQTPYPNYLILESRDSQGQTTRFSRVDGYGRLIFQRAAYVENNVLAAFESFIFLAKVLKAARKMCSHLAFYGDVSVGLTVTNAMNLNLSLGFPQNRPLLDNYNCKDGTIFVSRTLHYDDFTNLSETIQSMFSEFCRVFHFAADSNIIAEIVEESFLPLLK